MAAGDVKLEYAASSALTITLASLATSATWIVGRESTEVINSVNKYLDYLLAGKITTGTTPTVDKQIRVYVWGTMDDTPTRPLNVTGADAGLTPTEGINAINAAFKLATVIFVTATSNVGYTFGPLSVAALFAGQLPKRWGIWVTHDTVAALHATGGNHVISITPTYLTVAP